MQKLMLVTFDDNSPLADMEVDVLMKDGFNYTFRAMGAQLEAVEDLYPDDEMGFNYVMMEIDNWRDMNEEERADFAEPFLEANEID